MAVTERASLDFWRRAMIASVRSDAPDMTTRQQAILMIVGLSPGPHTVRGLAEELEISKPAVTRALDALEKLNFVKRLPDERDQRSIIVERTITGAEHLRVFARLILDAALGQDGPDKGAKGRAAA